MDRMVSLTFTEDSLFKGLQQQQQQQQDQQHQHQHHPLLVQEETGGAEITGSSSCGSCGASSTSLTIPMDKDERDVKLPAVMAAATTTTAAVTVLTTGEPDENDHGEGDCETGGTRCMQEEREEAASPSTSPQRQSSSSLCGDQHNRLLETTTTTAMMKMDPQKTPVYQLSQYQAATTQQNTIEKEWQRLQVLKRYFALDRVDDPGLDLLTGMAARTFDVPVCLVSLVDWGRLWFISNHGLEAGNVRSIPRKDAFCSHAILPNQQQDCGDDLFIIENAATDPRFCNNPIVTGAPHVRFYAGAPLWSVEGFALGNFCLIDTQPRPGGLTSKERATLTDHAKMAMKLLLDRRYQIQTKKRHEELVAYTAHNLMTPLTGLQLSVGMLHDDADLHQKINSRQRDLIQTAKNCGDIMTRICEATMETLRDEIQCFDTTTTTTTSRMSSSSSTPPQQPSSPRGAPNSSLTGSSLQEDSPGATTCRLTDLAKCLNQIMLPIPKAVPLRICIDPAAPECVICDDIKLIRAALNFLATACHRTTQGVVTMNISYPQQQPTTTTLTPPQYTTNAAAQSSSSFLPPPTPKSTPRTSPPCSPVPTDPEIDDYEELRQMMEPPSLVPSTACTHVLLFECEDTAPPVSAADQSQLFQPLDQAQSLEESILSSYRYAADLIRSLGGSCGYVNKNVNNNGSSSSTMTGSIFWFRVPVTIPPCELETVDAGAPAVSEATTTTPRNPFSVASESLQPCTSSCESEDPLNGVVVQVPLVVNATNNEPLDPMDASYAGESMTLDCKVPVATTTKRTNCLGSIDSNASSSPLPQLGSNTSRGDHETVMDAGEAAVVVATSDSTELKASSCGSPGDCTSGMSSSTRGSSRRQTRQRRALVIDDSLVVRKSVGRALSNLGYVVTLAQNGMEGLKELKEALFDITLCDFLMPVMDGLDCVKQYREWESQHRPWFRQYIVGISAHANVNDCGRGLQIGMNEFKPKPITMKVLKDLVYGSSALQSIAQHLDNMLPLLPPPPPPVREDSSGDHNDVNKHKTSTDFPTPTPPAELTRLSSVELNSTSETLLHMDVSDGKEPTSTNCSGSTLNGATNQAHVGSMDAWSLHETLVVNRGSAPGSALPAVPQLGITSTSELDNDTVMAWDKGAAAAAPSDSAQVEAIRQSADSTSCIASTHADISSSHPRQRRALVIDDTLVVRKSLGRALSNLGYVVTLAQDGMEGLNKLKRTLFDVTLCDFCMPVMNGVECVQQYREWEAQNRPWFRQYIVGMSAHANETDCSRGLQVGMNHFKRSPIRLTVLKELHDSTELQRVAQHLDKIHRSSPRAACDATCAANDAGDKQQQTNDSLSATTVCGFTISPSVVQMPSLPPPLSVASPTPCQVQPAMASASADSTKNQERLACHGTVNHIQPSRILRDALVSMPASAIQEEPDDAIQLLLEHHGWQCTLVYSSNDAFQLLKMRNWDAVVLHENLMPSSAISIISEFRAWEADNRVNRQQNVFLQGLFGNNNNNSNNNDDDSNPTNYRCVLMQPPTGFDGVVNKQGFWKDFENLVNDGSSTDSCFAPLSIITR